MNERGIGDVGGKPLPGDKSRVVLLFQPFRLDPADARLWRGKRAVALNPKSFAVLHHLLAHAGRLVTKGELLDAAWSGVHVGDAVVKTAVKEIRRALGDSIEAPRFITTVHRRGYRFIASVSTDAQTAAAGSPSAARSPVSPSRQPHLSFLPSIAGREAELANYRRAC